MAAVQGETGECVMTGESDSDKAMRENMDYTLELADKILRSSKDPLTAFIKAVGTLAQVIHIITADEQREETVDSVTSMLRTYLEALDAVRGPSSPTIRVPPPSRNSASKTMKHLDKHWTNALFAAYGTLYALVLGILLAQLIFGSISFWNLAVFCLASVVSFLAGAGAKGSLLIGTTSQLIAGSLLGALLIAGCLWMVHWLNVVIVFTSLKIAGDYLIVVSALTGFVGATKWDAFRRT